MGKILQIRVSAWTYREEDVFETWSDLSELAWPRPPYPGEKRGVLELVTALENGLAFGNWPKPRISGLKDGIAHVVGLKARLEEALANWEPREANSLSDQLEDALDVLETYALRP